MRNEMNKIIYIHGLNSSTEADNAKVLKKKFGDLVYTPNLPNNPANWEEYLNDYFIQFKDEEMITIIGSSTGGFFADYFADKYGYNKVLINPLVDVDDLKVFVGENTNFHTGEKWTLTIEDIQKMKEFVINKRKVVPTYLFLGVNDDVLDYRKAEKIFDGHAEIVKKDNGHIYKITDDDLDIITKSLWVSCIY
jgi:hypothetical protein